MMHHHFDMKSRRFFTRFVTRFVSILGTMIFKITLLQIQAASPSQATDVNALNVPDGFRVELIYSVPKEKQGSWVSMAVDPKGRLIVSDQYGGLYRITLNEEPLVEALNIKLGQAQGLLYAFDSLYVMVSNRGAYSGRGLYRVRDLNGDDQFDQIEYLRALEGGGEHGPHAIVPAPDGKSLFVVVGNQTKLTKLAGSKVPQVWDEDLLLPRAYGNGFMKGVGAPGGCIYKIDPDGKHWELIASGFRNQYDVALNRDGELFTFDADMEWDMNTPWYRPTRVCHVVSGAEFGWRNGSGKWPPYYPDSIPATIDIGPGSPTGICFGYGTKFPAKYQEALFICDWSYGKLYAVHLKPKGASYEAHFEEFISGSPLPLTDILVNQKDGAMYFTIGGRRTKSALYRITYQGKNSQSSDKSFDKTKPNPAADRDDRNDHELRELRRRIESFHGKTDPDAVDFAWQYLSHPDRFLRYAARVAIEHQPAAQWEARVFGEGNPETIIQSTIALARVGSKSHRSKLIQKLDAIPLSNLDKDQKIRLLRAFGLIFTRMGSPTENQRAKIAKKFDNLFPSRDRFLDAELCKLLVFLQSPPTATKAIALLERAPTQEEQIEYALSLRHLKAGWTPDLRARYFKWFNRASSYRGGAAFRKFVNFIRKEALDNVPENDKEAIESLLKNTSPPISPLAALGNRSFVKEWTLDELTSIISSGLQNRNFNRGRKLFGEVACFACHRFANEGGSLGPDLTGVAGRFSPNDLLESILNPSKEISDQYASIEISTNEGERITGRIMNLSGNTLMINVNMFDPNQIERVDRTKVESIETSKISMMPEGLLNMLDENEVLDLTAFLLSRGDADHAMFQK